MAKKETEPKVKRITIPEPNLPTVTFKIRGTSNLVTNAFSEKAWKMMRDAQEAGSKGKNTNRQKEAKDFQEMYEGAKHVSTDGWCGIPASAFRNAMISACRISGVAMTKAKLSIFVLSDGQDKVSGDDLVKITKGNPEYFEAPVRLPSGTADIHARPKWLPGWEATVRVRFDQNQFEVKDVANLLMRAGMQVGVGEGRHDSKNSAGLGWGCFELVQDGRKGK